MGIKWRARPLSVGQGSRSGRRAAMMGPADVARGPQPANGAVTTGPSPSPTLLRECVCVYVCMCVCVCVCECVCVRNYESKQKGGVCVTQREKTFKSAVLNRKIPLGRERLSDSPRD